jgi:hypothetical protein
MIRHGSNQLLTKAALIQLSKSAFFKGAAASLTKVLSTQADAAWSLSMVFLV